MMTLPALPPLVSAALLLDLDGTLLDFAPTPDTVIVPPGLPDTLRRLRDRLGDALAIVTGRPVETIEALLPDCVHAIAGEHGGAVRHRPAAPIERPDIPPVPAAWLSAAQALERRLPGTLLERKARGFAMHFRRAPTAGPEVRELLARLTDSDPTFELLGGTLLWEVRPRGFHKGRGIQELMAHPPFSGRLPLFIGDDVTDEDGIKVAFAMGGVGLRVDAAFGDPAGVRAWLAAAAWSSGWPPLPGPRTLSPGEDRE